MNGAPFLVVYRDNSGYRSKRATEFEHRDGGTTVVTLADRLNLLHRPNCVATADCF